MSNLRPFQIVFMAVFGILALIGLYVFATFSVASPTVAVGSVEVWGTLPKEAVKTALDTLSANQKQFSNVSYTYVRPESFSSDVANALAAGGGPDLVILSQEQLVSEMDKLERIPFTSIPERAFRDTYAQEFEIFLTTTGTYGIPLAIDPLVLYYNRSLLSSAGIAAPPTTWEAVTGLSEKLTLRQSDGTVTRAVIPFGSYDNMTNARALISLLFLQAGSPITMWRSDGLHAALLSGASPEAVNATESALSFFTQFSNPAKTVYSWNPSLPNSRQAFLSGDLFFYPGFASEAVGLHAANPNLDFDMAAIPQPGVASSRTTYGIAYVAAIPKVAKNKSGAYSVAVALTGGTVLPLMAQSAGMAPSVRSQLATPPGDLYAPVYYPAALISRGWLSPAPSTMDGIFAGMIQNVTSGRMDADAALTAAGQSIDAALK